MRRGTRAAVGVACMIMISSCGGTSRDEGQQGRRGAREAPIPSVEVIETRFGALPLEQRLSGVVRARNQVTVYSEVNGRIEEVLAENGDFVEIGQALVRMNSRQLEEQLKQAQANLRVQQASAEQTRARTRELEAELQRNEQLAERDFVSQLEITRLRAQVEAARADHNRMLAQIESAESTVSEREWMLERTVIRSPVSGMVGRRNAEVGMRVDGSTQLFVVGDLSSVQVRVTLTEQMLRYIEAGQRVLIRSDHFGDSVIEAMLSRISPFLEAGTFSTEATVDVPNPDGLLRSGMYVDVDILYGESEEATLVPNSALHENPRTGRMGVFLAPDLDSEAFEVEVDGAVVGPAAGLSSPTPIRFQEIDVVARGRAASGVRGIPAGSWVVVVGHDLLSRTSEEDGQTARTRAISWDRMITLQELQQHHVLEEFMERQRRRMAAGAGGAGSSD